ncbi:Transcription factor glial cells missing 2 [Echinococcus granulosus]|uniref:Transcription factor glial cells missing 2 n=1 Tax=Echinococcus granulosus TaxID=6210 RepID=W6UET5_ECHGR|nr:Transcription factor glial cells missing 2 [Echinococcus granulosus]EUB59568.1 Transcription factor glial cells missing 2 [Echinococcus granulosus]
MSVVAEVDRSGYHHNHSNKSHQDRNQSGSEAVETKPLHPNVQIAPSTSVQHSVFPSFSESDTGASIPEYTFYQNHHQLHQHQQQSWCLPEGGVLFYPPQPLSQPQIQLQAHPQPPPHALQTTSETMPFYSQQGERTEPPQCIESRMSQRGRSKSSGSSTDAPWDIKDSVLPMVSSYDPYDLWPDGNCRRIYSMASERARRHQSGWAMRNTNNHNPQVLKKSCLGVLVCSLGCISPNGLPVAYRPAICDKARKKQCRPAVGTIGVKRSRNLFNAIYEKMEINRRRIEKTTLSNTDDRKDKKLVDILLKFDQIEEARVRSCTTPGCKGRLVQKNCKGHGGYPVTHFWRFCNGAVFFQAKGRHDHVKPTTKALSSGAAAAAAATGSGKSMVEEVTAVSQRRKIRLSTPSKIVSVGGDQDFRTKIAPTIQNEAAKHEPTHLIQDSSLDFQQHQHQQHHQASELESLLLHQQNQQLLFQPIEEAVQPEIFFQTEQRQHSSLEYFMSSDQSLLEPSLFSHAQGSFPEIPQSDDQYPYSWRPPAVQTSTGVDFLDHLHLQQESHQHIQQDHQQQPYLGMLFAGSCATYNTDGFEQYTGVPENSGSTDASTPGGVEGEVNPYPVVFDPSSVEWSTSIVQHTQNHYHHHQQQQQQVVVEGTAQMQQQQLEQQTWFLNPHLPWKPVVES